MVIFFTMTVSNSWVKLFSLDVGSAGCSSSEPMDVVSTLVLQTMFPILLSLGFYLCYLFQTQLIRLGFIKTIVDKEDIEDDVLIDLSPPTRMMSEAESAAEQLQLIRTGYFTLFLSLTYIILPVNNWTAQL